MMELVSLIMKLHDDNFGIYNQLCRLFIFNTHLVEVIVGTPCDGVEEHEVLKVGDLSPLPLLRHVRRPERGSWLINIKNKMKIN